MPLSIIIVGVGAVEFTFFVPPFFLLTFFFVPPSVALSIIIVGVGEAEFSNMNALDSDTALLSSRTTGRKALRDIVQVVDLRALLATRATGTKVQMLTQRKALAVCAAARVP
jgi:hypothetical protein